MRSELEEHFGRTLQIMVANLIKNAEKVPAGTLDSAQAFETFMWHKFSPEEKKQRIQTIMKETSPDTSIGRHYENYPHPYSRRRYQDYLALLKHYSAELGA